MKIEYKSGRLSRVAGHTALESQCVTAYACPPGEAEVKVAVPQDGNYVVDVTVERVRAPLPEDAEWIGTREIRQNAVRYGATLDGAVWGSVLPSRVSAAVPSWALEAFRAEGLIK
jgi:hypothetical protein